MRPLTPAERRVVEQIKKTIPEYHNNGHNLVIHLDGNQADTWLNIFAIVLETDNVLREQWRKSYGSVGNVVE